MGDERWVTGDEYGYGHVRRGKEKEATLDSGSRELAVSVGPLFSARQDIHPCQGCSLQGPDLASPSITWRVYTTGGRCGAGTGCCRDHDIEVEILVKVDNYKFLI